MTIGNALGPIEYKATGSIYTALVAAQADMGTLIKGSVNPAFKSRYADLADVVNAVSGPLNRAGIAFFHEAGQADGQWYMRTVLVHGISGTKIECDIPLIIGKNDMQGYKSASTYAKRIGLESLTGVAPEDDDGNAAAKAPPKPPTTQELAAQVRGKPGDTWMGLLDRIQKAYGLDTRNSVALILGVAK